MSKLVKILLILLVIAVAIFLILLVSAKAFGYGTIGSLLGHLGNQLGIIWNRIFS